MVDISQNGEYGYHYPLPANCHFNSDEADTIASADSEITLATTKFGGKDPGQTSTCSTSTWSKTSSTRSTSKDWTPPAKMPGSH